jgi:hypothetical protein
MVMVMVDGEAVPRFFPCATYETKSLSQMSYKLNSKGWAEQSRN